MKMNKDQYKRLKHLITETLSTHGLDSKEAQQVYIEQHYESNPKIKDVNVAFRWQVFHAILPSDRVPFLKGLYDSELNDDHIDTALRKIFREQ